MKHIYDASCIIEYIENEGDYYKTSCNILKQFEVESKPKDLKDAWEILKSLLIQKEIILIFDNVKNQSQIEDVVLMHDFFASNNGTLIMITWNWKAMEIFRINIKEFDEEKNLRLFITYSYGYQDKVCHKLVEVGK